ncbi:MAG: Ig-like domain repeat protein [Lachnospiraceae bacterium]|nr:Ig-like domain repeat protein [Lachnospiraceae bacterium]
MRIFTRFMICLSMFVMTAVTVSAEENDRLKVDVSTYDGQSVMVMDDHPFYTSMPVVFKPQADGRDCWYSISLDGGSSFGTYAKADSVTIYPDDDTVPDGKWYIKFKGVKDGASKESAVYRIVFDTTCPKIEPIDIDEVTGWITSERSVHFRVSDAESGIKRIVTKSGDKVIGEIFRRDDEVLSQYELTVDLKDRGPESDRIDIECFDLAGNNTGISYEYRFDASTPRLSASGAENGKHYNEGRKIELSAQDPDSEAYIDYSVKRKTSEETISTDVANAPADTYINCDEDGIYTIEATAVDGAGNRSDKTVMRFAVDTTPPSVSIGGVTDNVDFRTVATVSIDVSENSEEPALVDIKLNKTTLGRTEQVPIESYNIEADRDVRTVDIKNDGEYRMEVTATDRAGNSSTCVKNFRIDRTAPQISISGLSDGEVTNQKPVIRFGAGELFYDSTIMTAILEKKDKKGYVIEKRSDQVMRSASDHVDVVPAHEGEYRLTCTAADRTGNSSTSSVSFTIDRTPPVISSLSDVDNGYFKSFSLPAKLSELVRDRTKVDARAYVDDAPINDKDVIIEEGKYVLTILAEDEASNVSEESATFIVDHTAPQIVLGGFDKNGNVKKGSMIDVSLAEECDTLRSVRFNGRNIAIGADNTAHIAVDDYGEYDIAIKAEDPAGNVTDTQVHTSCYLIRPVQTGLIKTEKNITSNIVENDKNDADPQGLAVGLISVLSGTLGLAFKGFLRD